MSDDHENLINLYLLDRDAMTEAQIQALSEWIMANPDHTRQFIRATVFHRKIHDYFTATDDARITIFADSLTKYDAPTMDQELFELMRMEQSAPGVALPSPSEPEPRRQPAPTTVKPSGSPRLWLMLALTSMGMMVAILLGALLLPSRPKVVATLIDTYGAQWASLPAPLHKGDSLLNDNQPKQLLKGLAEIEFDNGAVVVMEAPIQFSILDTNRIALAYGQLTAKVPPAAVGFRIDTLGCKIIDLGTEFGVQAAVDGQTDVHMFNGKAALRARTSGDTSARRTSDHTLEQGQARSMDAAGRFEEVALSRDRFVRQFSSATGFLWRGQHLNLADMVGGGNGWGTGTISFGIDNETGNTTLLESPVDESTATFGYVPVSNNPYIDGIFIPEKNATSIQVTSLDHRYATNLSHNGLGKHGVFNGHRTKERPRHLQGIDYRKGEHPYIDIHANQGITFDLRAIRTMVQGLHRTMNLASFTAHAGIAREAIEAVHARGETVFPSADISILVDGQARFQKTGLRPDRPAIPINVPLQPEDGFLTILATDGGGNTSWDWVLVVDPTLDVSY